MLLSCIACLGRYSLCYCLLQACSPGLTKRLRCSAVAEILRFLVAGLHDALRKAPSEAVLLDNYARVCIIISEIINEVLPPPRALGACCRYATL